MEGEQREPIELTAIRSIGLGFDLTSDFWLRFAKGYPGKRLVMLDEKNTADLVFSGGFTVHGVSSDIRCDKGEQVRFCSDVDEFNQMSELLNQKSLVRGKVPSGYFNALFGLSGPWLVDAKETKHLAFNGCFISSYILHLRTSPLVLCDEVGSSFQLGTCCTIQEGCPTPWEALWSLAPDAPVSREVPNAGAWQ